MSNRVKKMREKDFINWQHVPTDRNPVDIDSSQDCSVDKISTEWWNGPSWILCQQNLSPNISTKPTVKTKNKKKRDSKNLHPNNSWGSEFNHGKS